MNRIQFGTVKGSYTLPREEAARRLTSAAKIITAKTGTDWVITLSDQIDEFRVAKQQNGDAVEIQTFNSINTFEAEARAYEQRDTNKAEEMLKLLLGMVEGLEVKG